MRKRSKLGLGALIATIAIAIPVITVAGWYPNRPLKKWESAQTPGFNHVTFNSFWNTPFYGNETEFFDGKATEQGHFKDKIQVQAGQEITLRTYVHNGADPSLNGPAYNQRGIARNTKVKIELPTSIGTRMNAVSQISASNAQPGSVFDTAEFESADGKPFKLSYVAGSAVASTHSVARMPLSDSIVGGGALIGETAPDGNVPGCFGFASYVNIKVKVEPVALQVQKTVAKPSQAFVEQVNADKGQRLYFKIDFKNTGQPMLNGIALSDQLPDKLQLIPGTVKLYNASNPQGAQLSDTALFTAGGQGVGDYAGGVNGYVLYQVTVKNDAANTLTNVACVRSEVIPYNTCDDAKVVVPPPPPVECLPGIPVGDARCNPTPPQECKPGIPVGDARCNPVTPPPTTPETPTSTTLPQAGVESGLAGLLGMTGLSASIHAYRKSKKAVGELKTTKSRR